MTRASEGLRLGDARASRVLAEMQTEQILAELSDEQRASLTAALSPPPAPAPTPVASDDPPPAPASDGQSDDYRAGAAAERARVSAVLASEHFPGREAHVAKLLGKGLSAEDTIDLLADLPKREQLSAEEQRAAAEEAGRKEMQAEINRQGNPDLGADENKDGNTGRAKADAVWTKAYGLQEGTK